MAADQPTSPMAADQPTSPMVADAMLRQWEDRSSGRSSSAGTPLSPGLAAALRNISARRAKEGALALKRSVSKTIFEAGVGHHDMRIVYGLALLAQWGMLILCWALIILMPYARLDGSMYMIEWVPIFMAVAFISMMTLRDLRGMKWFQFRSPRLWLVVTFAIGWAIASLRGVSMTMERALDNSYSEELTMRYVSGIPLFVSKFFGMDLMGYLLGAVCFWVFFSLGMMACCLGNCCSKTRTVDRIAKIIQVSPPIMDMVQDRQQIKSFSVVAFVLPFTLVFSLVLGGQVLAPPDRVFRTAGPPVSLVPLCSPPLSGYVRHQAARLSQSVLGLVEASSSVSGANPLVGAVGAIGRLAFELAWSSYFEGENLACAVPADEDRVLYAVRLPHVHVTSAMRLPNMTLALRDAEGLASSISADGLVRVSARLVSAPTTCNLLTWLEQTGGPAGDGVYHINSAGLVTLSSLTLRGGPAGSATVALCPGEHTVEVRSLTSRADGDASSPLGSPVVRRIGVMLVAFDTEASSYVATSAPMVCRHA